VNLASIDVTHATLPQTTADKMFGCCNVG